MTVYFVRTSGNDTTGTGATGAPWLTIDKALSIAGAGDTIKVGDGTYAESSAGAGFLLISKNLGSTLSIEGENGAASAVIITGTSGSNNTLLNGTTANVTFKYLTFGLRAGSSYAFRVNAAASNLAFDTCVFDPQSSTAAKGGVYCVASSTWSWTASSFTNCTVRTTTFSNVYNGIYLVKTGAGAISGITWDGGPISGVNGVRLQATINIAFSNCTITGSAYATVETNTTNTTYTNVTRVDAAPSSAAPTNALYYVTKAGDDTTGDGSLDLPWLTIAKALTVAGNGDTVLVGDGTYTENSGSGYLNISKNLSTTLTIQAAGGPSGAVVITGTSSTHNMLISATTAKVTFRYINFLARAGSLYPVRASQAITNILFDYCTFTSAVGGTAGFYVLASSTWNVSALSFTHCTWVNPASGSSVIGLYLRCTSTGTISGVSLANCTVVGQADGVYLDTITSVTISDTTITGDAIGYQALSVPTQTLTNVTITGGTSYAVTVNGTSAFSWDGGTAENTGAANCVMFGIDGASGGLSTVAMVKNLTIRHSTSVVGHALIFGNGCTTGCLAEYITVPQVYDFAVVIKENTGVEVRYSTLRASGAAGDAAVYCKAAVSANVHHNILIAPGGGACAQVLYNSVSGNKSSACVITDNRLIAYGSGICMNWGDSTQDAGGGTCDRNIYDVRGTGSLGTFAGTAATTLTAVRAAWAAYGDGSNDSHSRPKRRRVSIW